MTSRRTPARARQLPSSSNRVIPLAGFHLFVGRIDAIAAEAALENGYEDDVSGAPSRTEPQHSFWRRLPTPLTPTDREAILASLTPPSGGERQRSRRHPRDSRLKRSSAEKFLDAFQLHARQKTKPQEPR
jgi:hypothetical protein